MVRTKFFKSLYANIRLYSLVGGVRASNKYDDTVKSLVNDLEEGFKVCLAINNSNRVFLLSKEKGELVCKLKKRKSLDENINIITFKNLEYALPVLRNKSSFLSAFNESKIIVNCPIKPGIQMVRILSIVQAYLVTAVYRKKYLKVEVPNKKNLFKIKTLVMFRGILWKN